MLEPAEYVLLTTLYVALTYLTLRLALPGAINTFWANLKKAGGLKKANQGESGIKLPIIGSIENLQGLMELYETAKESGILGGFLGGGGKTGTGFKGRPR